VGPTVTSIGLQAFQLKISRLSESTGLTGLDLSEATALETIGDSAFKYNNQLTGTLKVGPAVTSIGRGAFAYTGLTGLDLSEATALETIGGWAFDGTALAGTTVTKADGTRFSL
jgi:hypothetical protein